MEEHPYIYPLPEGVETVPQMLLYKAAKLGDQTAMRAKEFGLWRDISWADYGRKSKLVGMGLIALGVEPGDVVAVIGENCPEWLFADMGAMMAGGVTAGIYTTNAAEECGYVLTHSEAKVYIVENEEQLDKALEVRDDCPALEKIIVIDTEGLRHFTDSMVMDFEELLALGEEYEKDHPEIFEARLAARKPNDLALLIYTSGTTGPPKGAMLSHRNVLWAVGAITKAMPLYGRDELVSFLPLCHIAERMFSVFIHLFFEYTINFIENTDTVTENIIEVSPTVMFAVPRIWEKYSSVIYIKMKDATWFKRLIFGAALKIGRKYAEVSLENRGIGPGLKTAHGLADLLVFKKLKERLGLERLRVAVSGAAPISPDVLKFYHAIGIPLRQVYGQTEGTGIASIHQEEIIEAENVGPSFPGITVKIADDGEILVKGGNVFLGYFNAPEATAETIVDGWLLSGDVGELDDRGYLTITDRKKDLIITRGGKNIAPQYLENKLKFSPYINDAVAIGDNRKFVTALIFMDEDNVVKFAQDNKVQYSTYASLTETKEVLELIRKEIDTVNKTLARVEQIKKFRIIPKQLIQEDGEVTPTMKLKRKYINETYSELIEGMYGRRG